MQHRTTIIVSALALLLASPPLVIVTSEPAQAQRRILGPLTAPFRMILRGVPRVRAPRAHRAPRANRDVAGERSRSATRRQLARGGAAAAAAGAAVFWPIGAPDAFEDMIGYAFWPREYGRQFWSHGPGDILRAMTAPAAAFAAQADASDDGATGARLTTALVRTRQCRRSPIARSASRGSRTRRCGRSIASTQTDPPHARAADRARSAAHRHPRRHRRRSRRLPRRPPRHPAGTAARHDRRAVGDALRGIPHPAGARDVLRLAHRRAEGAARRSSRRPSAAAKRRRRRPRRRSAARRSPATPIRSSRSQRALRPTDEQRKHLQMLYGASMEMAQFLTTTCPAETPSTPMARLDAASDRVMSLLHAAMNIEPILGQFYA